jgi:hypothetical protein
VKRTTLLHLAPCLLLLVGCGKSGDSEPAASTEPTGTDAQDTSANGSAANSLDPNGSSSSSAGSNTADAEHTEPTTLPPGSSTDPQSATTQSSAEPNDSAATQSSTAAEDSSASGAGGASDTEPQSSAELGGTSAAGGETNSDTGGTGPSAPSATTPAMPAQWQEEFPSFTSHTIADFGSGYYVATADVDGDGLQDVVGLSSGGPGLVWFKNPTWEKYTVTTATQQFICFAPHDVDGDGDVDLAVESDFNMNDSTRGGTISWVENPDDPTMNQEWALHAIDEIPTAHRVRFGDLDGDGSKELIVLPIFGIGSDTTTRAGAVELTSYTIPADPKGAWTGKIIDDTHLEVAHGISIVDWDGDGAEDILTAANDGVDLFRLSQGDAPLHLGAGKDGTQPDKGSSKVGLGSLGGSRFIATIEPWHGTDTVVYTPGASESDPWTRTTLGTDFEHGHAMAVVDLNGDGYDEIVGGGGQGDLTQLIYRYLPSSESWEKLELDIGGVAVSAIDVTDIDADGDLDIVAIGGSPTNNVVWYENSLLAP